MKWISTIASTIDAAFNSIRKPATPIPPILLLCEIMSRPGLSAITLTSNIISRFPEIGIPTDVNIDGSPNISLLLAKVISEEVINHIHTCGFVDIAQPPRSLNITGVGMSPNGPITFTGTNQTAIGGKGLMR